MEQKEQLVDLLLNAPFAKEISQMDANCAIEYNLYLSDLEAFADYLLQNGVTVPPCKV